MSTQNDLMIVSQCYCKLLVVLVVANLSCESRAKILVPRKWNLSNRLKHRTLAGRLIAANNKLREFQDTAQALAAQIIHNVKNFPLFVGLECLKRSCSDRIGIDRI